MLAVTAPPFFWLETEKRYQRGHVPRKTHPKHDPSFKLSTTTPSLSLDELKTLEFLLQVFKLFLASRTGSIVCTKQSY